MEQNEKMPDVEIAKKGGFLTWLENFWYHYKWHTIIIGIAVIILSVCLWQTASTEKHDTVIVYAGPMCLSTGEIRQLEEVLSGVLPSDRDGNGEKNASMSMYQIYSEEQIKELAAETDELGASVSVDITRNSNQYETYSKYMMTGESSVCFVDPWLYEKIPEEYLYPMSKLFGDKMPKGAIDGYGVRLGDTDLYKDYGIVRGLPADTIICLRAPYEGLGHSVDDAKYQFEMETFKAFVSYASDTANSVESATDTDTAVNEKKEEEAA